LLVPLALKKELSGFIGIICRSLKSGKTCLLNSLLILPSQWNRKPTVRFVRLSRFSACQDARLLCSNVSAIQLRSTTTGKSRELIVPGWEGLKNIDWSADGKSLLVAWHDFKRDSALLNVNLDGKVSVLVRSINPEVFYGIPSPNGRLLAITEAPQYTKCLADRKFLTFRLVGCNITFSPRLVVAGIPSR
jgi:hypothetical protein